MNNEDDDVKKTFFFTKVKEKRQIANQHSNHSDSGSFRSISRNQKMMESFIKGLRNNDEL